MGLMILKCPHCGQSNLIKENEHYRCPVCESIIFNDDYKTYQETVEKLIQEGKEADIGELRNSFNEELQQEHLDVSQLKNICNDIKRIISDDKIANYFIRFLDRNRYPGNYELYLQELAKEKLGNYEQKIIIPVMVDKCKRREVELVNEVLKVNGLLNEENKDKIEEALVHRKEEKNLYDSEKKVFICHSHKDIKKVKEIAKKLERNHISCWYSERNLPWDIENYWVGIYKAIEKCEVFLFILSEDALDSDDVIKEINKANELGKKIRVEYKIDESENDVIAVRRFFDGIQWIDGSRSNQYDELVEKIYNYLENDEQLYLFNNNKYSIIENIIILKKYDEALEEIEKQMMINPNDIHLLELLLEAQLKGKKEKNTQAIRTYEVLYKLFDTEKQKLLKEKYFFLLSNEVSNSKTLTKEEIEEAFQKGKEFFSKKDYKEAVKWYLLAAEQGHSDGQNNLGYCYHYGKGVTEDYQEAVRLYKLSAEQGNKDAQYNLGYCYHYGQGVTEDSKEAVKWYKLAAEQGDAWAQNNLGNCYYYGEGVTQDYQEAVRLYKLAADQGNKNAQNNLANRYYYGEGVTQDYKEAVKWYKLSANQGNKYGQNNLGNCYYYGYGVTKDYKEAVRLYKLAAEQDYGSAQNNLGDCYYFGKGVTQDYQEAVKWFRLAAEQGNDEAQLNLGFCYFNGDGAAVDYKEAVKWFRLAAEQGNDEAQFELGCCYSNGDGAAVDYKEAVKWFKLSAEQGNDEAQFELGCCYYYGFGEEKDIDKAVAYMKQSAEQNNKKAKKFLMKNRIK